MHLPTADQVKALHERFAPHPAALDLVWTHCEIVARIAEQVVARLHEPVDGRLVRAGALLHDVGVHRLYEADGRLDHRGYVRHGLLGEELLRGLGLPEILCRFCSHHTGVGITHEDVVRQGLPLPARDYLAETLEEEVVMYADSFHSKTSPPVFLTAATYATTISRFGADKAARFEAMVGRFGEPHLDGLSRTYGFAVV